MRTAAAALVLLGLVASPLGAQGRGDRYGTRGQGIPPGHLPPPGECRVWYEDRPAGQQPPPTSCRQAERVAARDRYARVIYGEDRDRRGRDDGRWDRDDDRRDRGRAIPRDGRDPYPERYPSERGGYGYGTVPFDNGYKDGYEKGREDARDIDAYRDRSKPDLRLVIGSTTPDSQLRHNYTEERQATVQYGRRPDTLTRFIARDRGPEVRLADGPCGVWVLKEVDIPIVVQSEATGGSTRLLRTIPTARLDEWLAPGLE